MFKNMELREAKPIEERSNKKKGIAFIANVDKSSSLDASVLEQLVLIYGKGLT